MAVGSAWHQSYHCENIDKCTRVFLQLINDKTYPFLLKEECALLRLIATPSAVPEHQYQKISSYYEQDPQSLEDRLNPIGAAIVPDKFKVFPSKSIHPINDMVKYKIQRAKKKDVKEAFEAMKISTPACGKTD